MSMIISRTPFRISYVGGGTDFPDFFLRNKLGGQVISTTINKYIYITITEKFDGKIHLRYADTECVDKVDDIKHNIFRECLKMTQITHGVELTSISDIPCHGSGLGSSSAFTVGSLKALYAFKGYSIGPCELAEKAAYIERIKCNATIGVQDQFASAFGNLNSIIFNNSVCSRPHIEVNCLRDLASYHKLKWLEDSTLLFYLGVGREASIILKKHNSQIINREELFNKNVGLCNKFINWLKDDRIANVFAGELINQGWEIKKAITPEATNPEIDKIIKSALDSGACGAKVCGAGNGGFLMVICNPSKQQEVRNELSHLHELKFNFSSCGSQIIYNGRCQS